MIWGWIMLVDLVLYEGEFFVETGKDQDKNSNRQTKPIPGEFFVYFLFMPNSFFAKKD